MSTLKVDTLQTTGGAGLYPAQAWVNYDQDAVNITNSANVSSVTDDAVGVYTVSFTNAFSAATYCAGMVGWRRVSEGQPRYIFNDGDQPPTTTSSTMYSANGSTGASSDIDVNRISWTL
jgi:hypothetical protein